MYLCCLTSVVVPNTCGWAYPPPIVMFSICIFRGVNVGKTQGFAPKPTGLGRDERCVGRRTGESCFSGCVRVAYELNVSFVVCSVKACVWSFALVPGSPGTSILELSRWDKGHQSADNFPSSRLSPSDGFVLEWSMFKWVNKEVIYLSAKYPNKLTSEDFNNT